MSINVEGVVTSQSTVFMLTKGESIFFLKLNDGRSESTILMPLKKINYSCFLDQNIKITNLKEATLFKSSTSPQKVLQFTKQSAIQESSTQISQSNVRDCSSLISFKGIVTGIHDSLKKIYILDKKVYLFLCLLPNHPEIHLGDNVSIRNAHITSFLNKKCLVVCGASSCRVNGALALSNQEETNSSIFSNLVLQNSYSWGELVVIYENFKRMEILTDKRSDCKEILKLVSENEQEPSDKRSPIKEYLDHPNHCCLQTKSNSIRNLIVPNEVQSYVNESSQHKSILIGKLKLDRNDIFLCDKYSQIIILCDTKENFKNDNLVIIKNWNIFGEMLDDKPIVIAKSIIQLQKNLKETENNEDIFGCDTNYRIINKSSILQLKIHQFFLIELLSSNNEKYLVKIDDLNHFFGWKVKDSVVFHEDDHFQICTEIYNTEIFLDLQENFGISQIFEIKEKASYSILPCEMEDKRTGIDVAEFDTKISSLSSTLNGEVVNIRGVVSEVINDDNGTRIVLNEDLQSTKLYLRACYNCPPKGIVPKTVWRFCNVVKQTSRKNNIYLSSTALTRFEFISCKTDLPSKGELFFIEDLLNGTHKIGEIVFSVNEILKLSLEYLCVSCGSSVYNGYCTYVGCKAPPSFEMIGSLQSCISDSTDVAFLVAKDIDCIFTILNISSKEKLEIEEELKRLGRFYYSKWNKNPQDSSITRFLLAAENNFHLFKGIVKRYVSKSTNETKLFCTEVSNNLDLVKEAFELELYKK